MKLKPSIFFMSCLRPPTALSRACRLSPRQIPQSDAPLSFIVRLRPWTQPPSISPSPIPGLIAFSLSFSLCIGLLAVAQSHFLWTFSFEIIPTRPGCCRGASAAVIIRQSCSIDSFATIIDSILVPETCVAFSYYCL